MGYDCLKHIRTGVPQCCSREALKHGVFGKRLQRKKNSEKNKKKLKQIFPPSANHRLGNEFSTRSSRSKFKIKNKIK